MICRTYLPGPPLCDFVHAMWLIEGCVMPHGFERVMPSGDMQIVINLFDDSTRVYNPKNLRHYERLSGSLLCGAHSSAVIVDAAELRETVGVHFKAGGAFPFFKLPVNALQDVHVTLEEVWGEEGRCLREQLLEARRAESKFQILERALLRRAAGRFERHRAVQYALGRFQRAPHEAVSGVTEETGLSERRFIQLFANEVGLTPKLYCRVQRFQKAVSQTFGSAPVDWAEVALDCGYFDQAHFIHDFVAFSGLTPSTYLRQRTGPGNHVPIAD